MKSFKKGNGLIFLASIVVIVIVFYLIQNNLFNRFEKVATPISKTNSDAGLWEECDPEVNNCETDLECVEAGKDIHRCIKYLNKGEECGVSVAEICDKGLVCTDTDEVRQRCSNFSLEGGMVECIEEALQFCL